METALNKLGGVLNLFIFHAFCLES